MKTHIFLMIQICYLYIFVFEILNSVVNFGFILSVLLRLYVITICKNIDFSDSV